MINVITRLRPILIGLQRNMFQQRGRTSKIMSTVNPTPNVKITEPREEGKFLSFEHFITDMKILNAETDSANMLNVTWNTGIRNLFPLIYLRDICKCSSCFNPEFKQRVSDVLETCALDYSSVSVNVMEGGTKLEITWSDNHLSRFDSQWLYDRQLRDEQQTKPGTNSLLKKGVVTWGSEMSNNIPTLNYHEVMSDDLELLKWLDYLLRYGLVLIRGAPAKRGHLMPLASRVGYTASTFYADPLSVPTSLDTGKLHNRGAELPFHTDMKYTESTPAFQLLHCINQAEIGGESRFNDGFSIACELKQKDPEAFNLLKDSFVPNQEEDRDCHGDFITRARKPTIELDFDGTIKSFNFHETSRDLYHCTTLRNTESFIHAYGTLVKLVRGNAFSFDYKMNPGEIIALHNQRVLHARHAYSTSSNKPRKLESTYFDCDPVFSKIRILARKMNIPIKSTF